MSDAFISYSDIEEVLRTELSPQLRDQCKAAGLRYAALASEERDQYLLEVFELLAGEGHAVAGQRRQPDWESGWSENLMAFRQSRDAADLVPHYHGKHRLLHWRQQIIKPLIPNFDYLIHCLLVDWAVETFLANCRAIFEFGCGPAYHLLRARRFNAGAHLVGLDWATASQSIIREILASGTDSNISGRRFDFYNPDELVEFGPAAGVLTVAALEQVGDRFEPFLHFLLQKKPMICVHLEPIDELMDEHNLIDRLSVFYCRKRNYLHGFLTSLRALQEAGQLRILREQRTYTGSFYIEGHSLIVWAPL